MNGLNLANFKKMKEDKKTVTMGHPDGHSITILKSKLKAIQREQIKRLPVYAAQGAVMSNSPDGDSSAVSADQPVAASPTSINSEQQVGSDMQKMTDNLPKPSADQQVLLASNNPNDAMAQYSRQVPQAPADASMASPVPVPAKPVKSGGGFNVNSAFALGNRAIDEQAKVAADVAKAQADVQQRDVDARKAVQQDAQQNLQTFQQHKDDFANYIASNPINEKHYVENMGTGQKVATAIGLLLGGFTGGFNRTGANPAADWLNAQIGRDIEGQKARMDQQKTVLGANQELYHDQVLATNASRMNMNDIYDRQIQLAATKLGTPAAKAQADAQHSKFGLENAQLLQQNALRGAALQSIRRGGAGLDPITLGQAGFMTPEEAKKEQGSLEAQRAGVTRINDLYAQANKEQTAGNLVNPQSYKRIAAINSSIRDAILATDVAHRLSPEVLKTMLDPNLINTTDNDTTRTLKQNDILQKLQAHAAGDMPITARYAPGALPKYTFSTEDQRAIAWAKNPANAKDPRSAKILASASGAQ